MSVPVGLGSTVFVTTAVPVFVRSFETESDDVSVSVRMFVTVSKRSRVVLMDGPALNDGECDGDRDAVISIVLVLVTSSETVRDEAITVSEFVFPAETLRECVG